MDHALATLTLAALLGCLLLSCGVEDLRQREIANWKNALIALIAPCWWWVQGLDAPAMGYQLAAALVMLVLFLIPFARGWMGGGDVKLIAALALWFPLAPLMALIVVMSLAGGLVTMIAMIDHHRRRKTGPIEVPYGVAIVIAALFALREPVLNQFT